MEVKNKELLECAGLQLVQTGDGITVEHINKEWPQYGDNLYCVSVSSYSMVASIYTLHYMGRDFEKSMVENRLAFQHREEAEQLANIISSALKPIVERQKKGGII